MSLLVKKGTFQANTVTGNQPVTGVGFQPKAVIFWLAPATADANAGNAALGFGMAASATEQTAYSSASDDTVGTSQCSIKAETTEASACLNIESSSGVTPVMQGVAKFVTMDSDGFTVNWTTAPTAVWVVQYLALGGTDITNATVKRFTPNTTVNGTSQTVTGTGFQPDFLLFFTPVFDGGAVARGDVNWFMGAAGTDGTTLTQAAQGFHDDDAAVTMDCAEVQHSSAAIRAGTGTTSVDDFTGTIASLDTDGFHVTWTDAPASSTNRRVMYLALKGGKYQVGLGAQKTSTGTQTYTTAFQGTGLFTLMNPLTADAFSATGVASFAIGGSDGTNAGYGCISQNDANTTSSAKRRHNTVSVIGIITSPTPTLVCEAGIPAGGMFQSTTFTLDWTTADATARRFLFVLFGSSSAGGTTSAKAGSLTAGGLGSGADAFNPSETGTVAPRGNPSAADSYNPSETGSLATNTLQSGADSFNPSETGSLVASSLTSGADVFSPSEAGSLLVSALGSGADATAHAESGTVSPQALSSGADARDAVEAGSLLASALLSGPDSFNPSETGSLALSGLLSGPDAATHAETASLLTQAIISGAGSKTKDKTGSVFAGTIGSGPKATAFTETGSLRAAVFGAGADAHILSRTGVLIAGGKVFGADVFTAVETGALLAVGSLTAFKNRESSKVGSLVAGVLLQGLYLKLSGYQMTGTELHWLTSARVEDGVIVGASPEEAILVVLLPETARLTRVDN